MCTRSLSTVKALGGQALAGSMHVLAVVRGSKIKGADSSKLLAHRFNPRRTQSWAKCQGTRSHDPEPIGVGFKAPNELTLPISSKPDPCLIALVTILARQAARDFFKPHGTAKKSAASRIKEGF